MIKVIKIFTAVFLCVCMTCWAAAQDQPKNKTAKEKSEQAGKKDQVEIAIGDEEVATGDFIYKPRGRRDPFWNLLQGKSVKIKREEREGIAGMLIDELELEGIIIKQGKYIALFKGPDGRPYDVKIGDSVYDGEVIKIDFNAVVFKRILTIALGGTKEKLVTLRLIPEEEASKQ